MKNLYYLFLCSILTAGCTKTDDSSSFSYSVSNLHDVTMNIGDTVLLPLRIQHIRGTQEPVALTVAGLPNPVLYWFSDPNGTPNFNTTLKLVATIHGMPGIYTAQVIATGTETGSKVYELKLTIPQTVPNGIAGNWNLVAEGFDDNNNNVIDNKETVFPGSKKLQLTFMPGHTGKSVLSIGNNPATSEDLLWQLSNNETAIDITRGAELNHCLIHKLAGRDLVLKHNNEWAVYRKQ